MGTRMKRVIGVCCLAAAAAVVTICLTVSTGNSDVVMKVNGEAVSEEEYAFYCTHYSNRIWKLQESGKSYDEACREVAVQQKVEQQIFAKAGVGESFQYEELQIQMSTKNAENLEKKEQGEAVYGLLTYEFPQFYDYQYHNAQTDTKEVLAAEVFEISEEEKYSFYEANKEEMFKKSPEGTFYLIDAELSAAEVLNQISAAGNLEEINLLIQELAESSVSISKYELREEDYRMLDKTEPELTAVLRKMEKAKTFSEIQIQEDGSWIVFCDSMEAAACLPYEEAEQTVYRLLTEQAYEAYLEEQLLAAEIKIY